MSSRARSLCTWTLPPLAPLQIVVGQFALEDADDGRAKLKSSSRALLSIPRIGARVNPPDSGAPRRLLCSVNGRRNASRMAGHPEGQCQDEGTAPGSCGAGGLSGGVRPGGLLRWLGIFRVCVGRWPSGVRCSLYRQAMGSGEGTVCVRALSFAVLSAVVVHVGSE